VAADLGAAIARRERRLVHDEASHARWARRLDDLSARLVAIDPALLDDEARVTHAVVRDELERALVLVRDGWLERDVNGTSSGVHALVEIVTSFERRGRRDLRWTIARLGEARAWANAYVRLLERGAVRGELAPRPAVASAVASIDAMLDRDAPANPFAELTRELAALHARRPHPLDAALARDLQRALQTQVGPALRHVRSYLVDRYLPRAPARLDRATYEHWLAVHLGEDHASPAAIGAWGRREVARLRRELRRAVHVAYGPRASLPSAMRRLALAAAQRFRTEEELLQAARAEVARARTIVARAVAVPPGELSIEPVPPHQDRTMLAQYLTPRDGSGALQLNTTALLHAQRRHELPALVTHETFGGHHLAALHAEARALPDVRRFAASAAFDEGWALYAEQLRDELGGYEPEERIGYLAQQLWRAARLVVDTGLHAGGMTRREAEDYLATVAFLPRARARAEVRRYLDCPAQALAYYVGKTRVLNLRAKVRRTLGARFDLRAFHRKLLSLGAIPLRLVEATLLAWARRRVSARAAPSRGPHRAPPRPPRAHARRTS
jgi:uncharacterized protein (DUF885 family)